MTDQQQPTMKTLFISDLHLNPSQPELIRLATDFLAHHHDADALYILGDLFNTWLGDDLIEAAYEPFINALRQLNQSDVQIYLMVGNRDFMLGERFAEMVGAELLPDPTLVELGRHHILLMHGDSLCIDDVQYQRYRKVVRNSFLQWCFLHLPLGWRQSISDKIKARSREQKTFKSAMIMDVNPTEVASVMQQHGVQVLIHGHTHRPAIHSVADTKSEKYRIVLGDWHNSPSYLCVDDDQFQLVDSRLPDEQTDLDLSSL